MNIPNDLQYTKEHEWIRIEGDVATVGITDHAQEQLGDVVFVELPNVGSHVEQDSVMGTVESVKAVSDIYCPLKGEIIETNKALVSAPDLVNTAPYTQAWMVKMRIGDPTQVAKLLSASAYRSLVGA